MDGFPETPDQAKALQAVGIMPKHVIILDVPDTLLLERSEGKRIDPETNGKVGWVMVSYAWWFLIIHTFPMANIVYIIYFRYVEWAMIY